MIDDKNINLFLRTLNFSDLKYTYRWHNNSVLYQTLIGPFQYVSLEAEEIWLKEKIKYDRSNHYLVICLTPDEPIGLINLQNIDWISRNGNLGIFIGETSYHGKGYGTLAVKEMLKYAFFELGLNRIELQVLADNESAIRVYQKCGFQLEGKLRKRAFKKGIFNDVLIMSVLLEDWINEYSPK